MRFFVRATLALLVFIASVTSTASASVSVAIPFDALLRESSAAALVTPVMETSVWEDGRIFTYTDVHVDHRVAGSVSGDDIRIRTLGGEVGDIGQRVEGEAVLTVGHPSLLFLRSLPAATTSTRPTYVVTARAQGQFPVVVDADGERHIRRSSGVGATVAPKAAGGTVLATDALHDVKVNDATEAIARAWPSLHPH